MVLCITNHAQQLFNHRIQQVQNAWRKYQSKLLLDFAQRDATVPMLPSPSLNNIDDTLIQGFWNAHLATYGELDLLFKHIEPEVFKSHIDMLHEITTLRAENHMLKEQVAKTAGLTAWLKE